ncbi:unnamed protein product [Lampetra planeri]
MASVDFWLLQARALGGTEVDDFCRRLAAALVARGDAGAEATVLLQRLHLVVSASRKRRRLPREVLDKLLAMLLFPTAPDSVHTLCAGVLRDLGPRLAPALPHASEPVPGDNTATPPTPTASSAGATATEPPLLSLTLLCDDVAALDASTLTRLAPVLLAQGNVNGEVQQLLGRVLRLLEGRGGIPEGGSGAPRLLAVLARIVHLYPALLTSEQCDAVSRRLAQWLRYTGTSQGAPSSHSSSTGFFSAARGKQLAPVQEVDGSPVGDFFTVLCIGQHYTHEQWLHLHSFSMLRLWLQACLTLTPAEGRVSLPGGSVSSLVSGASAASAQGGARDRLARAAFEYSLRVLGQAERKATKRIDAELQGACVEEALSLLQLLCRLDPDLVTPAFSAVSRLSGSLLSSRSHPRALLPAAHFLLHHGETLAVDASVACRAALTRLPSERGRDPVTSQLLVTFCRRNASRLSDVLPRTFPSLLKLVAWHTVALLPDLVELMPAIMGRSTALELFHSLLDLPVLTAALTLRYEGGATTPSRPAGELPHEATLDPLTQGMLRFLLREESGLGDTIDKLAMLHGELESLRGHRRVLLCARAAPVLLHAFFCALAHRADEEELVAELFPVLLERSTQLYGIAAFQADVLRLLGAEVERVCSLQPSLLLAHSGDVAHAVSSLSSRPDHESLLVSLVWAVGEHAPGDAPHTTLAAYFAALETLLYEALASQPPRHPPRVVAAVCSALAKLAARSQDLIPRLQLGLGKVCTQYGASGGRGASASARELASRARELSGLVAQPTTAQCVLGGTAAMPASLLHHQRDPHTVPTLALAALCCDERYA